ncbi:MAG: hypothetical protein RIQ38_924 [Pseudomonadota bacterium]
MQAWPGGGLEKSLDATTLLRAAAVVRDRGHVRDGRDADAQSTQGAHRRLAARTGAFDLDVEILDALFHCSATGHFRGHLGSEGRRFARTLEALATGRCPRQSIALAVGDGDDGVIERSVNVSDAVGNVLADFFAHALGCVAGRLFSHGVLFSIRLISSVRLRPCADPCGYGHWCGYADHASAGHGDDGNHGSSRCPSSA